MVFVMIIADNVIKIFNHCNRLILMHQHFPINIIIYVLCNINLQKNNPDSPPEDVGCSKLEVHSNAHPFIKNRTSHGKFFLCGVNCRHD